MDGTSTKRDVGFRSRSLSVVTDSAFLVPAWVTAMPILALTSASQLASPAARDSGPAVARTGVREAVGIDVTTMGVHVAHVVRRRDGWHWTARASVAHPQPLTSDHETEEGRAPTSEAVGRAVAASLPRSSDGRRRIATAVLPASVAVLRTPTDASPEAFGTSLRTDLGASLAAGSSIQSCSWAVGQSSRKMIYAVSGSASEAVGEAVEQAGYTCRRIDSRPHALARTLSLDASRDARIVIEWGWNDCTLIFANESPETPFLQPSLCRSLRGYGLSSAVRIAGRGEGDPAYRRSADRNLELLRPLVKAAAAELSRSFRLAESLPGVDASGPIVVCGAAAAAAALPDLLSAALGRPVRRWQWGGRARPACHPYAPEDCLFAVSLALACGETGSDARKEIRSETRGTNR